MNQFAEGVNEGYKNGNYAFIAVKHHDTTLLAPNFSDTSKNQILIDTLIKDQQTARKIAEAILFKIYGEENIKKQRPYEIDYRKGYCLLDGTLPKGMSGGTFSIVLKATDGQVVKLTHGK